MYFDRYLLDIFRIIPIHMVSSTIVVIRINYASFEACINLFEFQLKIQRKSVVHALSIKARSVNTQQNINIYVLKDPTNMHRRASK